jgi:phenylacetate-coenzyme A ligase PaaK-like adenylate-forming protein
MTQRMRMAGIGSTAQANPWHPSSQAAATLNSRTMRWWMPTLSLATNEPVPELVRKLNDWQPEMFAGYPSILRVLADEQLAGRLHLHPHFVMSGSEVLTDETRRRVEAAWGRVLFEAYGTTESGGGLAAECERHEGLHLFEDLAIVEVVDEHNRPVPAGVDSAKVLLTVLDGRTLPLIRYEVDDSLRTAGSLGACGRPYARIERILGRTWDALRLPAVGGGEATVQPLTFTAILDTLPVTGWQVVHEQAGGLTVLLTGAPDDLPEHTVQEAIDTALTAQGVRPPTITIERVATIPRTAAGKAPLIRSAETATTQPKS